jgi:hypothetical protein
MKFCLLPALRRKAVITERQRPFIVYDSIGSRTDRDRMEKSAS